MPLGQTKTVPWCTMKALFSTLFSLLLLFTIWLVPPATMGQDIKSTAKDAEGKMQSALGELTGDTGMKIKGEIKQGKAAAMDAGSDIQEGAKDMARKLSDAGGRAADRMR
jgi:uncharacterized protein YjbJ (UPF0337 family)